MARNSAKNVKLGFVGLGQMGGNMVARLLGAGYTVFGEERSRDHAQPLIDAGMHWCDTPRQVAEAADIVLTSLPNDDVLELVAAGPSGILAGLSPGKTWIDMSTVSPDGSRAIAERVRERGATMLDAPVSGSVPQVQSGTLTIMVGGDENAFRRVEPVLRELGTPTHIGDNGQGLVLKLAINISLGVQMLAFAEGLLLAERSGVDPSRARDVMASSAIGSPMLRARAPLVLDPPADAWFDLDFMHKDLGLALQAAKKLEIPLPTADAADAVIERSRSLGYGRQDIAALYPALEEIAGGDHAGAR
jgi:3-hydroxyisobutyrate dehydrogenase